MSAFNEERVLSVHHWTDRLFSFTTTRDASLRFSNGHFTMIGLRVNDKPLLRAYSIVSPNHDEHLEFLSIKVPDGPLTSRLQHIQVGDSIIVGKKPTGTLLIDYLLPAKNLYLIGTGTGVAPFLSIIRDPDTYERFETVVLNHGVREVNELAYHDYTQPRICGCQRSVKHVNLSSTPPSINDEFSLKCPAPDGQDQITSLFFNTTSEPGNLIGRCSFSPSGVCPDYVIDVGTRTPGEPYPWILEFQCVEDAAGGLLFAGVNFYSKDRSNSSLSEMVKSASVHGLDPFINSGRSAGLTLVNHSGCTYPPGPTWWSATE